MGIVSTAADSVLGHFVEQGIADAKDRKREKELRQKLEEHGERFFSQTFSTLPREQEFDFPALRDADERILHEAKRFHTGVELAERTQALEELHAHAYAAAGAKTPAQQQLVRAYIATVLELVRFYYDTQVDASDKYLHTRTADDIVGRVVDHIDAKAEPKTQTGTQVFTRTAPMQPSAYFRGREALVQEIEAQLRKTQKLVLLNGMGGIGKTETCRFLCHKYLQEGAPYDKIGWLFYKESLQQTLYGQLDGLDEQDIALYYTQAQAYLNSGGAKILLVLDNANEMTAEDQRTVRSLRCHVLLTSRARFDQIPTIEVDHLTLKDCRALYRDYSGDKTAPDAEIDRIVTIADRHTLSVELLAKTQHTLGMKAPEFYKELQRIAFDLTGLTEGVASSYNLDAGGTTGEAPYISHMAKLFDLTGIAGEELRILQLFSLLPSQELAVQDAKTLMGLDTLQELTSLQKKGWLNRKDNAVIMHAVIASVIRATNPVPEDMAEAFLLQLAVSLRFEIDKGESFVDKLGLFPVAQAIIRHCTHKSIAYAVVLNNMGRIHNCQFNYSESERLLEEAIEICKNSLYPDDLLFISLYDNIGQTYLLQKNYSKSLKYFKKNLKSCLAKSGEFHHEIAMSYNNISSVHLQQGNFAKALEYCKKALEILDSVLEPNHPSLGIIYNNLGTIYSGLGDDEMALTLHNKSLHISEKTLPPLHPDLLTHYNNIGQIHIRMGNYFTALELFQKAYTIQAQAFGPDHPRSVGTFQNIEFIQQKLSQKGGE